MDEELKKILGGPDLREEVALLERRLEMLHAELTKDEEKKSVKALQKKLDQLRAEYLGWTEDKETMHQIVRDYQEAKKYTDSLGPLNKEATGLVEKLKDLNAKADVYTEKAASAVLYKLAPELNAMRKDFSEMQTRMGEIEDKFKTLRTQEKEHLTAMKTAVDEQLNTLTTHWNEVKDKSKTTLEEIKTDAYKQISDLEDVGRTLDERNDAALASIKENAKELDDDITKKMQELEEGLTKKSQELEKQSEDERDRLNAQAKEEFERIKTLQDQHRLDLTALVDDRAAQAAKNIEAQVAILNDRIKKEDDAIRSGLVKRFETLENSVANETTRLREKVDKSLDGMDKSLDELGKEVAEHGQLLAHEVKENIPYQFVEMNERIAGLEPLTTEIENVKEELNSIKKVSDKIASILTQLKAENSMVTMAEFANRMDKIEKATNRKAPDTEKRLASLEDKITLLDVDRILALIEKLASLKNSLAETGEKLAGRKLVDRLDALDAKMKEFDAKAHQVDDFRKSATQLDASLASVRNQVIEIKEMLIRGPSKKAPY